MDIQELLDMIGVDPNEWEAEGGFGSDDNIRHIPCDNLIEQDGKCFCGAVSPIRGAGLI